MPDDGSCKLKHVAQYYMTLKCCVGWRISVVCDVEQHSQIYQNKTHQFTLYHSDKSEAATITSISVHKYQRCAYHWLQNITMEQQIDPGSYTVTAIAVVMILLMGIPLLGQFRMICFK